jgi:hypothetical protein
MGRSGRGGRCCSGEGLITVGCTFIPTGIHTHHIHRLHVLTMHILTIHYSYTYSPYSLYSLLTVLSIDGSHPGEGAGVGAGGAGGVGYCREALFGDGGNGWGEGVVKVLYDTV